MPGHTYTTHLRLLFMSLVLITSSASFASEEYYTWVDENGVTNYAERNPQGYNATFISPNQRFGPPRPSVFGSSAPEPAPAATTGSDTTSAGGDDADIDVDAQIADEKARIDAEIAAAKRSNCEIGKRNLAQLEAYARIRVKDDDGGERVLTDAEKSERIAKARQTIRENCRG